jgi:hypothetical protein
MLDEFEAYLLKYGDKALKRMGTERYSRQRQAFRGKEVSKIRNRGSELSSKRH